MGVATQFVHATNQEILPSFCIIYKCIPNFLLWMNGSSSSTIVAVGYFTTRDETAESRGLDAHC